MSETTECERELRLDLEDFEIQLNAALLAVKRARYATARAQLRGAMWIIDSMERRNG